MAPERFRQLYDVTRIAPLIGACETARDAGLAMMGWPDASYLRVVLETSARPQTAAEIREQYASHAEALAARLYAAAKAVDRQILDLPAETAAVDEETLGWVPEYKHGLFDHVKVATFVAALKTARDQMLNLIDRTVDDIRTVYES